MSPRESANSRLIVAAPKLLAACQMVVDRWESGDLFRYDGKTKSWAHWHLPGDGLQPYAVYVDETDAVWLSDWGANAILRFDPTTEKF